VTAPGKVYLVGAGPGDPGLITVTGLDRIREADVIVYDRLVSARLLDHARPDAELIYVGKTPGQDRGPDLQGIEGQDGSPDPQAEINRTLIEQARQGRNVVRLKGGDPFVFGRGGEEAEALRDAGIPFEVVPGITSAIAVPAYAGIPVTHRGVASSFAVVTGHEDPAKDETAIDWAHLATAVDTLVFLMGVRNLPDIVARLTEHGRSPQTPVAVIQWGTTPEQRTVTGTLADIAQVVEKAGVRAPAITVVGEVVRLRDAISWFEDRPLFGKRVLITRTRRQASNLARLLADEGAIPVELPSIEIEPIEDREAVDAAIETLRAGGYAWAAFTSANAVELFFEQLAERGLDARAFAGVRIAAIGPATAQSLAMRGLRADAVPEEYVAEAVVEALRGQIAPGDRVLLPRAESARAELVRGLEAMGAAVDEIPIYRAAVPSEASPEVLAELRAGRIDVVTFTSSSTVRNLLAMLGDPPGGGLERPLIACIGPITAQTARELGLRVDVVAEEYTVEGLVAALRDEFAGGASTSARPSGASG
jgi:uroporphyrinogen III methyltransferase/synthase